MPIRTIVIAPLAKLELLQQLTGFAPTANVYTAADATPRPVTHKARNGGNTVQQQNILNAATVDGEIIAANIHVEGDPSQNLDGCIFKSWNLGSEPNPYGGLLDANGLTVNETD